MLHHITKKIQHLLRYHLNFGLHVCMMTARQLKIAQFLNRYQALRQAFHIFELIITTGFARNIAIKILISVEHLSFDE